MSGYSKIRLFSTTKSKSMDFSDLLSFPQTPKPISNTSPNPTFKTQETKQIIKSTDATTNESSSEQEDEEANAERSEGSKVLRRNSSLSSTTSHCRFRFDKQSSTTSIQSAVKRAFSMRRSSSVSERYCRIYDQSVTLTSPPPPIDDEGMDTMQTRSKKKKDKRGKIIKACKRLFGL
ncbi:hypothetical protein L1049_015284 [Liquidambar formosana]|uniref:Uncharacterized protein n=1 Tax=Liquidambar formosana TaxID=63359 RepID=A0AAP0N3K3_LIQFO